MVTKEQLSELGFSKAASTLDAKVSLKKKLVLAYEMFRYVTQDKIDAFNEALKKKTLKEDDYRRAYDNLAFLKTEEYTEIPPADVLERLAEAKKLKIFDSFEIAKIESVREVKDPILFGRISGCGDRFFIAQWDDDVRIEDILKENEG